MAMVAINPQIRLSKLVRYGLFCRLQVCLVLEIETRMALRVGLILVKYPIDTRIDIRRIPAWISTKPTTFFSNIFN